MRVLAAAALGAATGASALNNNVFLALREKAKAKNAAKGNADPVKAAAEGGNLAAGANNLNKIESPAAIENAKWLTAVKENAAYKHTEDWLWLPAYPEPKYETVGCSGMQPELDVEWQQAKDKKGTCITDEKKVKQWVMTGKGDDVELSTNDDDLLTNTKPAVNYKLQCSIETSEGTTVDGSIVVGVGENAQTGKPALVTDGGDYKGAYSCKVPKKGGVRYYVLEGNPSMAKLQGSDPVLTGEDITSVSITWGKGFTATKEAKGVAAGTAKCKADVKTPADIPAAAQGECPFWVGKNKNGGRTMQAIEQKTMVAVGASPHAASGADNSNAGADAEDESAADDAVGFSKSMGSLVNYLGRADFLERYNSVKNEQPGKNQNWCNAWNQMICDAEASRLDGTEVVSRMNSIQPKFMDWFDTNVLGQKFCIAVSKIDKAGKVYRGTKENVNLDNSLITDADIADAGDADKSDYTGGIFSQQFCTSKAIAPRTVWLSVMGQMGRCNAAVSC